MKRMHASNREDIRDTLLGALTVAIFFAAAALEGGGMMGSGIKGPCLDCPDRNAGCHGKTEDGAWRCDRWAAYQAEQDAFRAKAAEDFKRVEVAMGYKRESRLRNAKRRTSLERRRRK